jgi:hypothetical protein
VQQGDLEPDARWASARRAHRLRISQAPTCRRRSARDERARRNSRVHGAGAVSGRAGNSGLRSVRAYFM